MGADIIIGGPPCQGFSMAGSMNRHCFIDDPRNYLFKHYLCVKTVKPKVFIMEKCKGIATMQGGKNFRRKSKNFPRARLPGWTTLLFVSPCFNAVELGVPQKRERIDYYWYHDRECQYRAIVGKNKRGNRSKDSYIL